MFQALGGLALASPFWTVFLLLVILFVTYEYRKRSGLPPGPYGLPFFGYMFSLDATGLSQQFARLCEEYKTDILYIPIPFSSMVVVNTFDLTKECFVKRTDMLDRSEIWMESFDPGYSGIITSNGVQWREARRFSISMLRDFGMGRIGAEEKIQNEGRCLCEAIKLHKGEAFDPRDVVNHAVSNVICGMVFGKRFESDDEEFITALRGMNGMAEKLSDDMSLYIALKYTFIRNMFYKKIYTDLLNDYNRMKDFVMKQIQEHKENYNGEVSDLIYGYLKDVEQGNHDGVFDDNMLKSLIVDYFFAGSETTFTTLRWCLLTLAAKPEMQEEIFAELQSVLGERDVTMNDKKSTPLTEAFLLEAQRYHTLVPLGVGRCNPETITINGYRIPPKHMIINNTRKIHFDPEYWKNPDEFDPENFLRDGLVEHSDKLIPFGIGRRSCAGESLARMELYVFFVFMVKAFRIKLETDETVADLVGVNRAVYQPKPFKLRFISRD